MRKFLFRVLFFLVPFMWWIYVSAQPTKEKDCSTTCFSSEVISMEKLSSTCTSYEIKVSYSGQCAHALSHFSVSIPCGKVENISNSEGWKQEIGVDPTTGINGFKIDDIPGFGEGSLSAFTVRFTLCSTGDECSSQSRCWQPQVAYKASNCVNYETLNVKCTTLKASLEKTDASCYGVNDGMLSVIVEDGQAPFSFSWADGSTKQSRSNLPAGDYSITVRDATGAEVILNETVGQPTGISIGGVLTKASCNGTADGAIDITVTGGTGSYIYQWSNGVVTEDLAALPSGKYTLTVKDERNCSATADFHITNESSINLSATQIRPDCNDTNGSINLTVSGGSEPHSFVWSNGAVTEDLAGIGAGLYKVTVTDNSGCTQEKSFIIRDNNTLQISAISTPTSCTDDASGLLDITVSGGTSPYEFEWSNGEITEDISGLSSGYYSVRVTDAKGCEITAGFTVSRKTFQVPKDVNQPACHGDNNGSITLGVPIGGTPPFTYEWSTGASSTSLTDLGPGIYVVTVTDATGCSRTLSTAITDPSEITASATVSSLDCNSDGSFAIDLTITGGTPPYSLEWSDGYTSEDRTALTTGTYTVVISDANGCSVSKEIIVEGQPANWSCMITEPATPPVCGSAENTLAASIPDADSYTWTVESSDGSWSITSGADSPSVNFSAGNENTQATFSLEITKDGCTRSCSYVLSTCAPDDNNNGEDPGGEEPGEEEPGGEEPGNDGNQSCEDCFTTMATLISSSGGCHTYELVVETNGLCRYDLSHWTLAIPCGTISDYSNSEGWTMEFGKDPTTGLSGLKVDGISSFGKEEGSFTVRFTLCESGTCDLSYWDPTVAYKAGQCVAVETLVATPMSFQTSKIEVYPNPFTNEIHFSWNGQQQHVNLEIIDQYGNIVSRSNEVSENPKGYSVTLESSALPRGMYYYRMIIDEKVFNGKISKR